MTAYMVVSIDVQDPSWVADYVANVPAIIASHGGAYAAVSGPVTVLEGTASAPTQLAIFTFPSQDAITAFMKDPAYTPYKEARLKGSTANIFSFDNKLG